MRKLTTTEFIAKAESIHGLGKYNYALTCYVGSHTKVIITCDEHGDFKQSPTKHLSGHGCLDCGLEKQVAARTKSLQLFIDDAKMIHFVFSPGDHDQSTTIMRSLAGQAIEIYVERNRKGYLWGRDFNLLTN